ncbi:MAG TPA: hypothetical protein VFM96_15085 [Gaiellaceae bacterium]|nr:hypothetical protein [Gaiellaceae bacterium]
MFETAIVAAGPMWGLLEDHAVVSIDVTSQPALASALTESAEECLGLVGEWVCRRAAGSRNAGEIALRVDLGLERDCGLDLTFALDENTRQDDLEALATNELVEIWVEDAGDLTTTLRVRARGLEKLAAILQQRPVHA